MTDTAPVELKATPKWTLQATKPPSDDWYRRLGEAVLHLELLAATRKGPEAQG